MERTVPIGGTSLASHIAHLERRACRMGLVRRVAQIQHRAYRVDVGERGAKNTRGAEPGGAYIHR
eukprot:scaffold4406_cov112-Isochrysis_galbana.AAC.15